jgi:hypothetical protein
VEDIVYSFFGGLEDADFASMILSMAVVWKMSIGVLRFGTKSFPRGFEG